MRNEFVAHKLSEGGLAKAADIAIAFDDLMNKLESLTGHDPTNRLDPSGRLISIVRTKLEEACFFAKKAMAVRVENQAAGPC